jgi:hypothetical protein
LRAKSAKRFQMKSWRKCSSRLIAMETECWTLTNFTESWDAEVILWMTLTVMMNEKWNDIIKLFILRSFQPYTMNLTFKLKEIINASNWRYKWTNDLIQNWIKGMYGHKMKRKVNNSFELIEYLNNRNL